MKVKNKTQSAGTSGQEAASRNQRSEVRISDFGLRISKKAENRDSPVGAAFPPASPERERWRAGSLDSNDFYAFYDFNDLTDSLINDF
ncbi:MAG: hypothetical protein JRD00_12795 [Deltaproteobacteria bacterium]|nr:hypothetical protein [Deltaproteobacteria bacterium]